MERKIIFGRISSGVQKTSNESWYRIEYLDADSGSACTDYVTAECFEVFRKKELKVGTICIGIFDYDAGRKKIFLAGLK